MRTAGSTTTPASHVFSPCLPFSTNLISFFNSFRGTFFRFLVFFPAVAAPLALRLMFPAELLFLHWRYLVVYLPIGER